MIKHPMPLEPVGENAVTLVCCGNAAFAAPTAVLFRSVMDHADPNRVYDLIYLHNGLDEDCEEKLCSMSEGIENVSIRLRDISELFSGVALDLGERIEISIMTFARLTIPDVLSERYRRVLYLDGDMIALRDVAELFDSDLGGKALGSSLDFGMLSLIHEKTETRRYIEDVVGLPDPERYCMSAMLVMDLEQMRLRFPTKLLLDAASSRQWVWHDQDTINHIFHRDIAHLDPAWDVFVPIGGVSYLPKKWRKIYDDVLEHPFIFHFAGTKVKPWDKLSSPYAADFWEIAERTPFSDELFSRLNEQRSFYDDTYGGNVRNIKGAKRFLRKIMPPPTESFQRDLHHILDCIDEQSKNQLSLMLRQHMLRPQLLLDGKWGADCTLPVKPVFSNAVTVVCCGDEFFAAPTGVLFRTIIDRASPQRCYDLLYLHNGIREETKTKLCSIAGGRDNISIRTCDIRPMFSENGLYVENRENFSTMSFARLITADVLDGSYKRAVYLNGNMIAFRDVAELYDSDLGGKPLGSSIDFNISVQDRRRGNREEIERVEYTRKVLGLSRMEDYIISGMLVMDLDRLRKDYPAAELVKTARSRKWLLHDQDVINHVFRGNIQMLDPAWDGHIRDRDAAMLDEELFNSWKRAEENPFIFHFAGMGTKPWEACCLKYEAEFWQAAGRTAFFAQLIRRKMVRLDTYNRFYSPKGDDTPMIKRFLKKILPPPVESFQRDLKVILDSIDRQKQLSFMLVQQMDELSLSREGSAASAGKACAHVPLLPSGLPQRNDPLGAEQPQQGRVGLRKPKN